MTEEIAKVALECYQGAIVGLQFILSVIMGLCGGKLIDLAMPQWSISKAFHEFAKLFHIK